MAIFIAEDFSSTAEPTRRVQEGSLRRIARGIYTDETKILVEEVVRLRWADIVGKVFPDAVVTYRSGLNYKPSDGALYISHPRSAPLKLPGLTVYSDGNQSNRQPDDFPLAPGVYGASQVRALADSTPRKGRPPADGRLPTREQLHDHIAKIAAGQPRAVSDRLVEQVAERATVTGAADIRAFFHAAHGEKPTLPTTSAAMSAASRSEGFDQVRVARFRAFASRLQQQAPVERRSLDQERARYIPFYDAYFSNFIEGTEFPIDEAEQVVFAGADFGRPSDAHDVRGTYEVVNDAAGMARRFASADEFMDVLRDRHERMMRLRPEVRPGSWKDRNNRAGATEFVDWMLVPGTLRAGWEIGQQIDEPFRRATFMMFMVSEVHPFLDGNGRAARVAMNTELVAEGQERVIIPTVLRLDYISALTRATNDGGPAGLHRVMSHAQHWVSVGDFSSTLAGLAYLEETNAMVDAREAERSGYRLEIPRRSVLGGYQWDGQQPRRPNSNFGFTRNSDPEVELPPQ